MLRVPADFPHVGSTCFLTPRGEEARILQCNANGSVLVAIRRAPTRYVDLGTASDTRTIQPGDFHATVEEALGRKPVARGRRSRSSVATAKSRKVA